MRLTDINGIGPKVYESLRLKGIKDINSLLYLFPSNYNIYKLNGFSYFEPFNAKATILSKPISRKLKNNLSKITFEASISDIPLNVTCFNQNFLEKTLKPGDEVIICGEYQEEYKQVLMNKLFKEKDYKEGIYPDYNIDGVNNPLLSRIMRIALDDYKESDTIIPLSYYSKYSYKVGKPLLEQIHFPKTIDDINSSKNALKYHELLMFSLKLENIRLNQLELKKNPKNYDLNKIKELINDIPFELTDSQKEAVNSICIDFKKPNPMNALLEGDTGSGKTIVSIIASYAALTSGHQVALVAPTEVLANQHYKTFCDILKNTNTNISLLTSSTKPKERELIIESLKNGSIDIIIGTHSLFNDEIVFNNLGFVILDEQHKFGVNQRKILRTKGNNPDVLSMSATPIPRTLALTVFNDVELIRLNDMPKGRKKINTFAYTYKDYLKVLDFIKEEINDHKKAYFVASCIDEDIESSYVSVYRVKEDLLKYYKNFRIGLLHGKMDDTEKLDVINKYKNNELDILVSTTVIEVGIDDKESTVIVVLDANRFGLSTLHQLRGRVGRGNNDSYCFFMVEKKDDLNRLEIFKETNDGFKIAEYDLAERGPGDFTSDIQSGLLRFNYSNIFKDKDILKDALSDSKELIKDPKIRLYINDLLKRDNFD